MTMNGGGIDIDSVSSSSSSSSLTTNSYSSSTLPTSREVKRSNSAWSSSSSASSSKLTNSSIRRALVFTVVGVISVFNIMVACNTFMSSWSRTTRTAPEIEMTGVPVNPCQIAADTLQRLEQKTDATSNKKRGNNDHDQSFPSDWKPELPKIIHHQWKDTDIPPLYQEWHNKWFELYPEPEYQHMLWTDESARQLIQQHYPWFLQIYDDYEYPIQRADAVRYFYLHKYGGIHTDLDYEPLINFYNYLPQDRVGLVESPYKFNEEVQNSLMSSPKGDPFWFQVFVQLIQNTHRPILSSTGPKLLDIVLSQEQESTTTNSTSMTTTALKQQRQHHDRHASSLSSSAAIAILPCENFQRIPLGEGKRLTDLPRDYIRTVKACGNYHVPDNCHFAKHHNTASYVKEFTFWDHLFNTYF